MLGGTQVPSTRVLSPERGLGACGCLLRAALRWTVSSTPDRVSSSGPLPPPGAATQRRLWGDGRDPAAEPGSTGSSAEFREEPPGVTHTGSCIWRKADRRQPQVKAAHRRQNPECLLLFLTSVLGKCNKAHGCESFHACVLALRSRGRQPPRGHRAPLYCLLSDLPLSHPLRVSPDCTGIPPEAAFTTMPAGGHSVFK